MKNPRFPKADVVAPGPTVGRPCAQAVRRQTVPQYDNTQPRPQQDKRGAVRPRHHNAPLRNTHLCHLPKSETSLPYKQDTHPQARTIVFHTGPEYGRPLCVTRTRARPKRRPEFRDDCSASRAAAHCDATQLRPALSNKPKGIRPSSIKEAIISGPICPRSYALAHATVPRAPRHAVKLARARSARHPASAVATVPTCIYRAPHKAKLGRRAELR